MKNKGLIIKTEKQIKDQRKLCLAAGAKQGNIAYTPTVSDEPKNENVKHYVR